MHFAVYITWYRVLQYIILNLLLYIIAKALNREKKSMKLKSCCDFEIHLANNYGVLYERIVFVLRVK